MWHTIMYISKGSGMDHKRSPDGATPGPLTEVEDIQFQLTTHLKRSEGMKGWVAWLVDL